MNAESRSRRRCAHPRVLTCAGASRSPPQTEVGRWSVCVSPSPRQMRGEFSSQRGAVLNGLDWCALHPRLPGRKRAGPVRRARGREQAGDIKSLSDRHNSANKLDERTLCAVVGIREDRFTRLLAFFTFFTNLQQNAGRVYDRRVK